MTKYILLIKNYYLTKEEANSIKLKKIIQHLKIFEKKTILPHAKGKMGYTIEQ